MHFNVAQAGATDAEDFLRMWPSMFELMTVDGHVAIQLADDGHTSAEGNSCGSRSADSEADTSANANTNASVCEIPVQKENVPTRMKVKKDDLSRMLIQGVFRLLLKGPRKSPLLLSDLDNEFASIGKTPSM